MPSRGYYDWVAAGKPYVRARPTADFKALMQGYGYTVYDYPNEAHQQAVPPEDHTAYSATGWPVASKRWVGHADDIMPPNAAAIAKGAVPLTKLARQIIADKDAEVPGTEWIKYLNWTDEAGDCWHTSWQPDKKTVASTDKGHLHISGRSDMDTSDEVTRTGWDPVRRAAAMTTPGQTDVIVGESILWDKAANRVDATGRNFANDVYKVISDSLGDEFASTDAKVIAVGQAAATGFAQLGAVLSALQSKLDEIGTKLNEVKAKLDGTTPGAPAAVVLSGTISGTVSGSFTGKPSAQ